MKDKKITPRIIIASIFIMLLFFSHFPLNALSIPNFNRDISSEGLNQPDKKVSDLAENVLLRDDFDDYTTNWRVVTIFSSFSIYDGMAELTIFRARPTSYSNVALTNKPQYKYNNMKIRAQINPATKGSKGWGFWNYKYSPRQISYVWFIYQQGSILYPRNGLYVMCVDGIKGYSIKEVKGFDVKEWHEYEIKWTNDSYDFYIDGENVAHFTKGVSDDDLGITIWNDNAVYYVLRNRNSIFSFFPIPHRIIRENSIYVDYIEITE